MFPKNKNKNSEKMQNSRCKMNPRANNTSKDKRHNMHKIKKLAKAKTRPMKGIKNQISSLAESPISVTG
jgi:hypothetical protein